MRRPPARCELAGMALEVCEPAVGGWSGLAPEWGMLGRCLRVCRRVWSAFADRRYRVCEAASERCAVIDGDAGAGEVSPRGPRERIEPARVLHGPGPRAPEMDH